MTRFEKAEGKRPSRGPGRVQAICVVSDLKAGANSGDGTDLVGSMDRYRQLMYSIDICASDSELYEKCRKYSMVRIMCLVTV
jgi:hypothetical protein